MVAFGTKQGAGCTRVTTCREVTDDGGDNFGAKTAIFNEMGCNFPLETIPYPQLFADPKAPLFPNTTRGCLSFQLLFWTCDNHFKMAMSHAITENFAKSWYEQKVDPNSEHKDPMHAKIDRNVLPKISERRDRMGRPTFRVRFKYFKNGRFKSGKDHGQIYQKKSEWRNLKPHETRHDAKTHMYYDIYMYLHRRPSPPPAEQKRKRQVKERELRLEERELKKDPKLRAKRRSTNFQLLMQDVREFNKKCLNQREKLRLRKRKPSTNIKPSSDHSGAPSKRLKKKTKKELKVEKKKAQIENLLVKFSELKATMKINYEWLRKVGFADHWQKKKKKAGVADDESSQNDESSKAGVAHIDESSQHDELTDSFQDDDVPTMMALANLSDKQVKQMYHQLVSLWVFCSIHIDALKECLAKVQVIIEAIKNGDECNTIGPGIPGISTSIKHLEHSWRKYGIFMYADKQAPKATKMTELVKHWLKEGTFKIPNWNKGGHQSWSVFQIKKIRAQ